MRWLAMPSRTRVESPCSAKKVFSASARAGTSATSPSRRMPGRRGATAPRLSDSEPLAVTSAAAMWPGSRSRPTIAAWEEERFLNTFVISAAARLDLTTKRAPEGPLRRRSGQNLSAYHLPALLQPYLPGWSQVRATPEPAATSALVIVNFVPVFEVTSTA